MRQAPVLTDLHTHTNASHAVDTVQAMYASARDQGIQILGFSEHSPRPLGYDYPVEYRDRLTQCFPRYVEEVLALKNNTDGIEVLLGMEMDWFSEEEAFIRQAASSYPFEYMLGSVHFLGKWPFDSMPKDWEQFDENKRYELYASYFACVSDMAASELFDIAAHPDIIKIFSVDSFSRWIEKQDSLDIVHDTLQSIKQAGMAIEVSSAGLRKPCASIYPCPAIMRLAFDMDLPIAISSDAHAVSHTAYAFDQLKKYAASFGYRDSVYFKNRQCYKLPFA